MRAGTAAVRLVAYEAVIAACAVGEQVLSLEERLAEDSGKCGAKLAAARVLLCGAARTLLAAAETPPAAEAVETATSLGTAQRRRRNRNYRRNRKAAKAKERQEEEDARRGRDAANARAAELCASLNLKPPS